MPPLGLQWHAIHRMLSTSRRTWAQCPHLACNGMPFNESMNAHCLLEGQHTLLPAVKVYCLGGVAVAQLPKFRLWRTVRPPGVLIPAHVSVGSIACGGEKRSHLSQTALVGQGSQLGPQPHRRYRCMRLRCGRLPGCPALLPALLLPLPHAPPTRPRPVCGSTRVPSLSLLARSPNFMETMHLVPRQQRRRCQRVHGGVAPPLVEEAARPVQEFKIFTICCAAEEAQPPNFEIGPHVAPRSVVQGAAGIAGQQAQQGVVGRHCPGVLLHEGVDRGPQGVDGGGLLGDQDVPAVRDVVLLRGVESPVVWLNVCGGRMCV